MRLKLLLPAIHFAGLISPKTIPSNVPPGFSTVSTLPPRWVRFAGATQATSVLSAIVGFSALGPRAYPASPPGQSRWCRESAESCRVASHELFLQIEEKLFRQFPREANGCVAILRLGRLTTDLSRLHEAGQPLTGIL